MSGRARIVAVSELPGTWRSRAEQLARYAPPAAEAFAEAAAELEAALREAANELLTLEQAAAESGYTADYLGRLLREGAIPNAGRKHAPRIRRRDLPRKATARQSDGGPTVVRSRPIGTSSFGRIAREAIAAKTFRRRLGDA